MTLTIHNLSTRCRSPRGVERPGTLVEDVARTQLAPELTAQLGPSLDRLPAVIRLKQLNLKLKIPARDLSRMKLASAWARAFTVSLHQALAHPSGDGAISLRRYHTIAAYKAAMLHHIATKGLADCWEFPELNAWTGATPSQAALGLLLEDANLIAGCFIELNLRGQLDPVLSLWDELSLERIMRALSLQTRDADGLSLSSLLEVGRAASAAGALHAPWPFASRRQAIRLWVRLAQQLPLRGVWHGLRLLLKLLEVPALLNSGDLSLLEDAVPLPEWCLTIVRQIAFEQATAAFQSLEPRPAVLELLSVLESLRPLAPSSASSARGSGAAAKWIASDCAGVLLMLSTVQRLDLTRFARHPEFVRFGGPRALSFLLAGIGMTLLRSWSIGDPIEPSVALFAGILAEPDRAGMKQFFTEADVKSMAEFGRAFTWESVFDDAATALARAFASRVRGFRRASREAVVKQFLRVRGRILVEEARLLVVLEPIPWSVALHVSGGDDPLDRVEWLAGRRVEFVLEGL
jgi:hypothetical protein